MFDIATDLLKKQMPHLDAPLPAQEVAKEQQANPAVSQAIGEIQQQFAPAAGAAEVATPEAKAAESAPAAAPSLQQLGNHGPAAQIAPIVQSVAEIKQTVAETQQAPTEAAQAPAPAPAAAAEQGAAEQAAAPAEAKADWASADHYNQRHASYVATFNQQTGGACGAGGHIDAAQVADWQREHGLNPDGMVGPLTVAASRKPRAAVAPEAAEAVEAAAPAANPAPPPMPAPAPIHAANEPAQAANAPAPAQAANEPAQAASAPTPIHAANEPAQAANAPAPAPVQAAGEQAQSSSEPAPVEAAQGPAAAPGPGVMAQLVAQAAGLLREFSSGLLGVKDAVEKLVAYGKQLGGEAVADAAAMIPAFTDQLHAAPAHQATNAPAGAAAAVPPVAPAVGEPFKAVVDGGSEEVGFQKCLVFASPGGVTETPDIFLFFHGHDAQYGIDDKQKDKKGSASGSDVAAEAMSHARGKNVIAILPQGVIGARADRKHEGGYMQGLKAGLPTFLGSILGQVAAGLGKESLSPGHISIAGHSAGGYQGVHDAMAGAGDLADNITDMTLMDTSYADVHFADASKWIFSGKGGKSLRIIGSEGQVKGKGASHHAGYFGKGALAHTAKKLGFEVNHLGAGDKRDNNTQTLQHSQILKDGQVHADILILVAHRKHGEIRDDVMDDAILSIGQGGADSDSFDRAPKEPAAPAHGAESGHVTAPAEQSGEQEQAAGEAAGDHQPVTMEDLWGLITQIVPSGGAPAGAAPAAQEEAVEKQPTDGLVQEHLEQKVGGLDDEQAAGPATDQDPAKQAWIHNTADATAVFPDDLKALYDDCVAKAKKGVLMFPAEKAVPGKTWAPFVKFRNALYKHFHYDERRINLEITGKKSSATAYHIKDYIHSVLGDLPPEQCAPGRKIECHREAASAFGAMHAAAKADGVDLLVLSGFREPKNKVSKNKYAVASNSSHSYGLALDLQLSVDTDHDHKGNEFSVKETTTGDANNLMKYYKSSVLKWMLVNGAKFNFFPYQNEPWHYEFNPQGMADQIIAGAKAYKK